MQDMPIKSTAVSGVLSHSTTAIIDARGSAQLIRLALVEPTTLSPTKNSE